MALIPGYDYDIFISYAHIDNFILPGQAEGWIEQFYKNLNLMLARRFGRMDVVKIWWDNRKLDGSVLFDQSISEGIIKSAIMICLNSPGYQQSKYCNHELDTFYKKAQTEKTGLKVGDRSRIINVLLNNIPFKDWPDELSGTSGFPFYEAKEAADFGDTVDILSADFRTQLQNLRDAVWNLLSDFPRDVMKGDEPLDNKLVKTSGAFTIFMGEVADTLRSTRKRLIPELEKNGFNVVTGIPPPDEATAHEEATREALKNSDIAINLLDAYPGHEIAGKSDSWYPQRQTELGMESGKSQMIWVPAETDFTTIEDEKYKLFLQGLETGNAGVKGYEFVRGAKSTLAKEIIDFAVQLRDRQSQKKAGNGKLSVLLDTHLNDQLYALDLSKTLLENQIQTFINPQEDDPRKNMNILGDRISQVRKLIFLYGSVSKEWVLERMSAALQLIITNNYPIEDFYIYMIPPHKERGDLSLSQKFLKVNVFDSSNDPESDKLVLQQFLQDLKANVS